MLSAMQDIWPEAPTYTLHYDPKTIGWAFGHKDIRTSFLSRLPFVNRAFRWFLPVMPLATERYDLSQFDVVISNSSGFAKGVITSPQTLHICYCHTPTRYLWSDKESYIEELRVPRPIKWLLPTLLHHLRTWDQLAAERVDHFIANSSTVQGRIQKYYRRDSTLIYPPVDTHLFKVNDSPKTYYLAGGRLVAYKRFDLIVEAFTKLGKPLVIFGTGPIEDDLKRRAGKNISFVGRINDEERTKLFENAIAFINPQEEDFGITVIEAMSAGRPVIAFRKGGVTETVIDGVTGQFFDRQTWQDLADVVLNFDEKKFNPLNIRAQAEKYSLQHFRQELLKEVEQRFRKHAQTTLGAT